MIGAIAKSVSVPGNPLDLDAGFSINGWLVMVLNVGLAHVFAQGSLRREDLKATV